MTQALKRPVLPALILCVLACAPEYEPPRPNLEERNRILAEAAERIKFLKTADPVRAREDLGHEDRRVRASAAQRLGEIEARDAVSVDALIAALRDESPGVCVAAATALGRIKDERAMEPLMVNLTGADRKTRLWAWKALRRFGEPAVSAMIEHLAEDSPLTALGEEDEAGESITIQSVLGELLPLVDKKYLPSVIQAIEHEKRSVRIEIVGILGAIGKAAAEGIPGLVKILEGSDPELKIRALKSLASIGDLDPSVVPAIKEATSDYNKKVAKEAERALKDIKKTAKKKTDKAKKKK